MNCIGTALASFVLLGYFVHQSELARVALAAERERSEHLAHESVQRRAVTFTRSI
jgi:hypothetical protein